MTARAGKMTAAAVLGVCIALGCASPPEPASQDGGWTRTGDMTVPRAEHVAALLPSGQVLVAGGMDQLLTGDVGEWTALSSSELYDPTTGTWTDAGTMLGPRVTRGLFPISKGPYAGKVMVAGGISAYYVKGLWFYYPLLTTTELFDPTSGTWSPGPPMLKCSVGFVQLANGNLLAVGSFLSESDPTPTTDVQLLDVSAPEPAWRFVRPMNDVRDGPALVLLDDGEILAMGGAHSRNVTDQLSPTAERYDPVSDRWTMAAPLPRRRWNPVVVKLPNGTVLFTAGCPDTSSCDIPFQEPSAEAWIYEPTRDAWRETTPMNYPRAYAQGVLLDSGKVLVAGGNWMRITDGGIDYYPAPTPEIFDPITETWSTTNPMPHYASRSGAMVKLESGAVLFSGGYVHTSRDESDSAIPGAQVFREGP